MPTTGNLPACSIYFHVPFCKKKCPYCHFYVVPDREDLQEMYLAALKKEWQMVCHKLKGYKIVSIYFGGGTPSLLGPSRLAMILEWIRGSACTIALDCEITLEANPENVTKETMQQFALSGVNRVSLGLQTLQDDLLEILGREHSASKSMQAVCDTFASGITNISVDLMCELPHQDLSMWRSTLLKVRKLPITHLSLYNLVIEPHTVFHQRKNELQKHIPDPETCKSMLDMAVVLLEEVGLRRYEISAFAKEGYMSRHNTGYWQARPFIGLGPSAFSYFDKCRYQNIANIHKYIALLNEGKEPVDFKERLQYPNDIKELLAVELRLLSGVDLIEFQARHAPIDSDTQKSLDEMAREGLLIKQGSQVSLSERGLLFYDTVAERII